MSISKLRRTVVAITALALIATGGLAAADGGKLARTLAGDLGISEDQAIGGTKALLGVAKQNLGPDEYEDLLADNIGLDDLSKRQLAGKAAKKIVGGDGGAMADDAGLASLAKNADLAKAFGDLGMDSDMIGTFAGKLLDLVGGGGPGSGLLSPKTKLLRKGLGLL